MYHYFKTDKAVHSVLFIRQQLGANLDACIISRILYFADQRHLSIYGRSITGDKYIAVSNGVTCSNIDIVLKIAAQLDVPNMDELSATDVKCLEYAINECADKSPCGSAWSNTHLNEEISVEDILREAGNDDEYIEYILDKQHTQSGFLKPNAVTLAAIEEARRGDSIYCGSFEDYKRIVANLDDV